MELKSTARAAAQQAPKRSLGDAVKKRLVQAVAIPSFLEIPNIFPRMKTVDAQLIHAFAEPGDIILSSDKSLPLYSALSKVALGSDFGHASLYIGDGRIIQSGPGGVEESPLFDRGTHFTLIKPEYQNEEDREKAVAYAKDMVGKPYDWTSRNEGDSVTCTDLLANALGQGDTKFDIKESSLLGTRAITPQAFLDNDKMKVAVDGDSPLWKDVAGSLPFVGLTVAGGVAGHMIHGNVGAVIGAVGTYIGAGLAWSVAEEMISPSLHTHPWEEKKEAKPDPDPDPEQQATADPTKPLLLRPEWEIPRETTTEALDRLGLRI